MVSHAAFLPIIVAALATCAAGVSLNAPQSMRLSRANNVEPQKPVMRMTFKATIESSSSAGGIVEVTADHTRLAMSLREVETDGLRGSTQSQENQEQPQDGTIIDFLSNRQYSRERFFDETVCLLFDLESRFPVVNLTESVQRRLAKQGFREALGKVLGIPLDLYDAANEYGGRLEKGCDVWRMRQVSDIQVPTRGGMSDDFLKRAGVRDSQAPHLLAALESASKQSGAVNALLETNAGFCMTVSGELLEQNISASLRLKVEGSNTTPPVLWAQDERTVLAYEHGHKPSKFAFDGARGAATGHCVDLRKGNVGPSELTSHVNNASRLQRINSEAAGHWFAVPYDIWHGIKIQETVPSLGTQIGPLQLPLRNSFGVHELKKHGGAHFESAWSAPLPDNFDPRDQWPMCPSIGTVKNQGQCGSCWAFSAVTVLADRFCIAEQKIGAALLKSQSNKSSFNVALAPGHLVDCDEGNNGCQGGRLDDVWWFLRDSGAPLEQCRPYRFCPVQSEAKCTSGQISNSQDLGNSGASRDCRGTCDGDVPLQLFRASIAYAVSAPGDMESLQRELIAHGPVQVAFYVFSDFHSYKRGVYFRTPGAYGPLGGHAVRLLGWGSSSMPYWLVANSWSPHWGIGGNFKIRRGTNECGIESTPAAGLPKFDEKAFNHIFEAI